MPDPASPTPGEDTAENAVPALPPGERNVMVRPILVRLIVIAAVLVTISMAYSLFRQWLRKGRLEPTAAIVVYGDESLNGTEIVVTRQDAAPDAPPNATATLNAENYFQTPVLLQPGMYHVSINWNGQNAAELNRLPVEKLKAYRIDLPTVVTVIGDEETTGAEIIITGQQISLTRSHAISPITAYLSRDNQYRTPSLLGPGQYHIMVKRDTQTLLNRDFTLEAHKAVTFDVRARGRG